MNNTQKLDDIRRRMRIIDMRLAILQHALVIVYERVTGGSIPSEWFIERDKKVLELSAKLDNQT